jgi:hypothetical protein
MSSAASSAELIPSFAATRSGEMICHIQNTSSTVRTARPRARNCVWIAAEIAK